MNINSYISIQLLENLFCLNKFNTKIFSLHQETSKKAKVQEHLFGRIACLAIPIFAVLDVGIGVVSLPINFSVWVIHKDSKKESSINFKPLLLCTVRTMIVALLSPVFAIITFLSPYHAAKFYFTLTVQKPNVIVFLNDNSTPTTSDTQKPIHLIKVDPLEDIQNKKTSSILMKELEILTANLDDLLDSSEFKDKNNDNVKPENNESSIESLKMDVSLTPQIPQSISLDHQKIEDDKFESFIIFLLQLQNDPLVKSFEEVEVISLFVGVCHPKSKNRTKAQNLIKTSTLWSFVQENGAVSQENKKKFIENLKDFESVFFEQVFEKKDLQAVEGVLNEICHTENNHRKTINKHIILLKDLDFLNLFSSEDQKQLKKLKGYYEALLPVSAQVEELIKSAIKNIHSDLSGAIHNLLKICEETKSTTSPVSKNLMLLQELALIYQTKLIGIKKIFSFNSNQVQSVFNKLNKKYEFDFQNDAMIMFQQFGLSGIQRSTRYKLLINEIPKKLCGFGQYTIDRTFGWRINISNTISNVSEFLLKHPIPNPSINPLEPLFKKKGSHINDSEEIRILNDEMDRINSDLNLYSEEFVKIYLPPNPIATSTKKILVKWINKREIIRSRVVVQNERKLRQYKNEVDFVKACFRGFLDKNIKLYVN